MASGKSKELAAITVPEPVSVVEHTSTNRFGRRKMVVQTTKSSDGERTGTPKLLHVPKSRQQPAFNEPLRKQAPPVAKDSRRNRKETAKKTRRINSDVKKAKKEQGGNKSPERDYPPLPDR